MYDADHMTSLHSCMISEYRKTCCMNYMNHMHGGSRTHCKDYEHTNRSDAPASPKNAMLTAGMMCFMLLMSSS